VPRFSLVSIDFVLARKGISVADAQHGGGKIVFEAVDLVRRRENRALRTDGGGTPVGPKHMRLHARENRCADQLSELRAANLRTARAGGRSAVRDPPKA
jgi:hypothetical protein